MWLFFFFFKNCDFSLIVLYDFLQCKHVSASFSHCSRDPSEDGWVWSVLPLHPRVISCCWSQCFSCFSFCFPTCSFTCEKWRRGGGTAILWLELEVVSIETFLPTWFLKWEDHIRHNRLTVRPTRLYRRGLVCFVVVLSFHTSWTSRLCQSLVCVFEGKTGFQTEKTRTFLGAKLGVTWNCHCIEINSLSRSLYLCSVFWTSKILIKKSFTTSLYVLIIWLSWTAFLDFLFIGESMVVFDVTPGSELREKTPKRFFF